MRAEKATDVKTDLKKFRLLLTRWRSPSSLFFRQVMEQFLHHPIDDRDEIIEAYLIGSRLVHFLSSILPTHPEYFAPEPTLAKLRNRAQSQLSELTGYAEVLAIMLDKQEHERYVSRVLLREESRREEEEEAAAFAADDGESNHRNPPELEGRDRNGDDLLDDDDGDSFGGLRPAPRALFRCGDTNGRWRR